MDCYKKGLSFLTVPFHANANRLELFASPGLPFRFHWLAHQRRRETLRVLNCGPLPVAAVLCSHGARRRTASYQLRAKSCHAMELAKTSM